MPCLQEQISVDKKDCLLISVLGKRTEKMQLENRIERKQEDTMSKSNTTIIYRGNENYN